MLNAPYTLGSGLVKASTICLCFFWDWKAAGSCTSMPINFNPPKTNTCTAGVWTQIKVFSWSHIIQEFILVKIVWCCRSLVKPDSWKSSTVLVVFGIHYKLMQEVVQVPFPPWYQHLWRLFEAILEEILCSFVRKISSGVLYSKINKITLFNLSIFVIFVFVFRFNMLRSALRKGLYWFLTSKASSLRHW